MITLLRASLVFQLMKHLPAKWETCVWSLGREDSLEKEMATHSSILACRIPWTVEAGRLQSMVSKSQTRLSDSHTQPCSRLRSVYQEYLLSGFTHFTCKSTEIFAVLPRKQWICGIKAVWLLTLFLSRAAYPTPQCSMPLGYTKRPWPSLHMTPKHSVRAPRRRCVRCFATPWTIELMGLSRPEYWRE